MNDQITYQLFLTVWILVMTMIYFKSKPSNYTRWLWLATPIVALVPFLIPESSVVFGEPILLPDVGAIISPQREGASFNLLSTIYWTGLLISLARIVRRFLKLRGIKNFC